MMCGADSRATSRDSCRNRASNCRVGHGRRQDLERDDPVPAGVVGPVDLAHPAATDQLLEPVRPEQLRPGGTTDRFYRTSGAA